MNSSTSMKWPLLMPRAGPACPQIYAEAVQVSLERPSGAIHRVEAVRHLRLLMRERGNGLRSRSVMTSGTRVINPCAGREPAMSSEEPYSI